jgi:hypothetical protein
LPSLLPGIFDALLARVDMACELEEVSLALLDGQVEVRGVRVWFRSDGEPLLEAAELRGWVDVSALWGGALRLERVWGRDVRARLVRERDGDLGLVRKIVAALPPAALDGEPGPLDVQLALAEVEGLELEWEDRSVQPPARLRLRSPRVQGTHVIPRRDGGHARIDGRVTLGQAGIAFVTSYQHGRWRGLEAKLLDGALPLLEAAPYLAAAGIRLSDDPELVARGRVTVAPANRGGVRLGLDLGVLTLREGGQPSLDLRDVVLRAARLDPQAATYRLRTLRASVRRLDVGRTAEGALTAGALILPPGGRGGPAADLFVRELALTAEQVSVAPLSTGGPAWRLTDVSLGNRHHGALAPILLRGSRPAESLPVHLQLALGLDPLCDRVQVDLHATRLGRRPELSLELRCAGLRSAGIESLLPGVTLAAWDGRSLVADLLVELEQPLQALELGPQLKAEVEVHDLRLGSPDDEAATLFAWEELNAAVGGVTLDPPSVTVDRLELLGLVTSGWRSNDRWTVAGAQVERGETPDVSGPELLIRHLDVHADALALEDRSVEPTARLLVTDADVAGSLRLRGGEVAFAKLQAEAGGDPGRSDFAHLGGAVDVVSGAGRGQISLEDLDLRRLRGLLLEQGVDLKRGRLDLELAWRRQGDGSSRLTGEAVLRALTLADAGGLARFLGLAGEVTLEAALFLLRDHEGEIRVSLDLTLDPAGEVGRKRTALLVAEAIGRALGRSLITSPLRPLASLQQALRGAFRLIPGLGRDDAAATRATVVPFASGDAGLSEATRSRLASLASRLAKEQRLTITVRHRLGAGDVARVEQRVAPSREVLLALVARLRSELRTHEARRREHVAALEAAVASGSREVERIAAHVRRLEAAQGRVQASLDQVLGRLREDAGRRVPQRVRRASQELAAARLEAVLRELTALAPGAKGRLRVLRPRFRQDAGDGAGHVELLPSTR